MTKSPEAKQLASGIATEFRRRLIGEQLPRISRCLDLLGSDASGHERIWRRPAANCNSVGNLVLHLCGNTTQWILATFAVVPDERDRKAEFAAEGGPGADALAALLDDVYRRACATVDALTVEDLLRRHLVQQRYEETGLSTVLHVLEHSSGHAGQIYAWTKQVTGLDLRFYDL